jgi:hypothetical protein
VAFGGEVGLVSKSRGLGGRSDVCSAIQSRGDQQLNAAIQLYSMMVVRYTRALRLCGAWTTASRSARAYATQNTIRDSTKPSRKQVTVVNDDGRVNWNDLTTREKAARSTQKTFHFGIILIGLVMTVWPTIEI